MITSHPLERPAPLRENRDRLQNTQTVQRNAYEELEARLKRVRRARFDRLFETFLVGGSVHQY